VPFRPSHKNRRVERPTVLCSCFVLEQLNGQRNSDRVDGRNVEPGHGVHENPFENGFDLQLRPERLEQPFSWRQPKMIFVNSMSDLFHKQVPLNFVDKVFDTMERADWHTYQILTKRSSRLREYVNSRYPNSPVPAHIWLGTSIEDGKKKSRARHIRAANASIRFLSIEPLLGPLGELDLEGIHWVIVGGESGPRARPMLIEWARDVRDHCKKAKVPFFFKQWGGLRPKSGGRLLDGREWSEWPDVNKPKRLFARRGNDGCAKGDGLGA
jgi:protein gp37